MSLPRSNYTQYPNVILDAMPKMGGAELRIMSAVVRKTLGWQKIRERIRQCDFVKLTGMSRSNVAIGCAHAVGRGWLLQHKTPEGCEYELNIEDEAPPDPPARPPKNDDLKQVIAEVAAPNSDDLKQVRPETGHSSDLKQVITNSPNPAIASPNPALKDTSLKEIELKLPEAPAGPKPKRGTKTVPQEDIPDKLQELAAVFEAASGVQLKDISKREAGPLFWAPLREMLNMANGSSAHIMRAAVTKLRQGQMPINSPKSVLKTFRGLNGAARAGRPPSSTPEIVVLERKTKTAAEVAAWKATLSPKTLALVEQTEARQAAKAAAEAAERQAFAAKKAAQPQNLRLNI